MGKLKHLMIHCAATIKGKDVRPEAIERMHMGCRIHSNGSVSYKGKIYKSLSSLPNEELGGVKAYKTRGRGWSRVGYSKYFTIDGQEHLLQDYNEDEWIDADEYTNGALGMNSTTRHFCYAGGLSDHKELRNGKQYYPAIITLTQPQEKALVSAIKAEIKNHPDIIVCGHNQYANKGCPSMKTSLWLEVNGIEKKNIDYSRLRTRLSDIFKSRTCGDKFRRFVNKNFPEIASEIDLDPSGSHNNDYILKAYYKLRHEYNS